MLRQIFNRHVNVDGIDIFYREAGSKANPSLLLLHGFPSSSVMFKNLMIALSGRFHLVAPDYPGLVSALSPAAILSSIPLRIYQHVSAGLQRL